ncbi:MAG: phytase [Flavobacteriaceae bacterium]|nr:phytase [Flavobacteriaceae bacterium]
MNFLKNFFSYLFIIFSFSGCNGIKSITPFGIDRISPTYITQPVVHDTDDPAIWINPKNADASLIIGTDKDSDGKLYAYNLQGQIVATSESLQRPNNVDIVQSFSFQGEIISLAITTERETNKIRVFKLPELMAIDNGGIEVFEGEVHRLPMGIALYQNPENNRLYAIVGRKDGPAKDYLFQYEIIEKEGFMSANLIRKFGDYSGKKEIEAIAVDNELGYIYYSDETHGISKYYADPAKGNEKLAFFGAKDFKRDMEGISIYKTDEKNGFIIISDQQNNRFNVYRREGEPNNPHQHILIANLYLTTNESDGNESMNYYFGPEFPQGIFVAMSDDKTFHIYDWRNLQQSINQQINAK